MRLAADRDLVARQYANGYADVFDLALPPLRRSLGRGPARSKTAIICAYLAVLADRPDTLIARKRGAARPREASGRRPRSSPPAGPTTRGSSRCDSTSGSAPTAIPATPAPRPT